MQNIHLTAYSPLGTPDSAILQKRGEETPHLMSDPEVKKIADKHGKHTATVSLAGKANLPCCALQARQCLPMLSIFKQQTCSVVKV